MPKFFVRKINRIDGAVARGTACTRLIGSEKMAATPRLRCSHFRFPDPVTTLCAAWRFASYVTVSRCWFRRKRPECGSVEIGQGKRARFLTSSSDFSVVPTGGHRKRSPAFSSQRLIPVLVDHHTYVRPTKERANPVARVSVLALFLPEKIRGKGKQSDQ